MRAAVGGDVDARETFLMLLNSDATVDTGPLRSVYTNGEKLVRVLVVIYVPTRAGYTHS